MPPWVRHQFPEASGLVRRSPRYALHRSLTASWCRSHRTIQRVCLKRWFGFDGFRPKPASPDGRPLQETIVSSAAIAKSSVSLAYCQQGPASPSATNCQRLSQFTKTGALTVVISPLVALMADQVEGMRRQGHHVMCDHQWHALFAGASGGLEPSPPRRRGDTADFARNSFGAPRSALS